MNRFVQYVTTGTVVFEDLTLSELVATMEAMQEKAGDRVEFTVIAHGEVRSQ